MTSQAPGAATARERHSLQSIHPLLHPSPRPSVPHPCTLPTLAHLCCLAVPAPPPPGPSALLSRTLSSGLSVPPRLCSSLPPTICTSLACCSCGLGAPSPRPSTPMEGVSPALSSPPIAPPLPPRARYPRLGFWGEPQTGGLPFQASPQTWNLAISTPGPCTHVWSAPSPS